MLTNFKSVSMNCETKNTRRRITCAIEPELDYALEKDMALRLQDPNKEPISKSALINAIIRSHYTGNFDV